MKRFALAGFSAALIALSGVQSWSKGIFITPGAREGGMGAAMVAVADEATAVYYNPAGLAKQAGSGAQISYFYLANDAKSNRSLGNSAAPVANDGDFPLGAYLPSEPAQYENKAFKTEAPIPFTGAYMHSNDITYALSIYGIGGGGGKWKDSVKDTFTMTDELKASLEAAYAFIIYNVSAAKELTPELSLGLGIDVVNMIDNLNIQKSYTRSAGSVMPIDYNLAVDKNATGYGIQFNGGLMYKISEKINTGLVVRSGTTINLKGKAKFISGTSVDQTDYDEDYTYPMTYGVGLSYDPSCNVTLAFGIDHNNYSSMHETIKYKSQTSFLNVAQPLSGREWKDTTQVRLGAEYRYTDKLAFRGGIQTDPAPFSTDQLTLTEINQYNFMYYSIGAGYKIGRFSIDFCYAYCPSDALSKGDRTFEYPLNVYRLGLSTSF